MEVCYEMALICSVQRVPKQNNKNNNNKTTVHNMNIIVPDVELLGSQGKAMNWKEGLYSRIVIVIYRGKFQILSSFGKCSLRRKLYRD